MKEDYKESSFELGIKKAKTTAAGQRVCECYRKGRLVCTSCREDGVSVNPMGSSDIGVRRTRCDWGWNLTLETWWEGRGGHSWEQKSKAQMNSEGSVGYEPQFCLPVEKLPYRPEAHLYIWGRVCVSAQCSHSLTCRIWAHLLARLHVCQLNSNWNGVWLKE